MRGKGEGGDIERRGETKSEKKWRGVEKLEIKRDRGIRRIGR